jgi:hypothetical protein
LGDAIDINDQDRFVDVGANNPLYFVGGHQSSPAILYVE